MKAGCARTVAVVVATLFVPASCAPAHPVWRDPHSHAQPDRVAVKHLVLDLSVDFAARQLTGKAMLTIDRKDASAPLVLDDDGLSIDAVRTCGAPASLPFELGAAGNGGRAL